MNTEEMHELLNTLGQEGMKKMAPDVPTPHCEACRKKYQEEQEALRKRIAIWSVLTNNPSAGQLTEIVNTDWPDELCSKSKLVWGSILSPANERDVIVITGTQNMENKPLIKAIIGRQPHMEKAIMEVAKEGKVVYASNTCSVSTESGTHGEEVQRYTFIAGVDDRECGEEEADQRLVGVLQKLKGICKLRDLRRLSLSVTDLMTGSRLRKLIEYVYQDEEVDIDVYTGARKRVDLVQEQETVGVEEWRTVSRSREKIVVKKVGNEKQMTYADLLKKMQSTIKVRDLGIKTKNIREAKNGNIEITAAGKNERKEAFIKLIEEKMQGTVEAQKIKPKRKIFIKDLHETTTGEEVRETLSKLFGEKRVDANDISVSMATKPNKGGKLFAIVNLPIEPNKKRMDKGGWYVDTYRDAAIKVLNRKQKVENSGRGKGYVWVEIDGVRIVSGYASPNIGIEEFKKYLGRLENCIRHARLDVLVAGDLNAKSPIWGSGVEDNRGAALADLLSANNMFAQNLGEKATFVGARGQSVIDITCATSGLAPRIQNWKVEDTETLSDHRLITYEIVGSSEKERKNPGTGEESHTSQGNLVS
jgi:acylphosphatase